MKASALEMSLMGERSTWSETEQHKNDPKTVHRRRGWLLHVSWVLAVLVVLSLVGIIVGLTSVQSKLDHAQTQLHKTEQTMRMMDTDLHATQARLDADMKEVKNKLEANITQARGEARQMANTINASLSADMDALKNRVASLEVIHAHPYPPRHV